MKPENFAQIPLHMIYQALQGVRSFNILTIFRSCQPNSPYDSDNQTCDRPWPTEILMLGRTKTNPLDEITLNLPNLPALVLFFLGWLRPASLWILRLYRLWPSFIISKLYSKSVSFLLDWNFLLCFLALKRRRVLANANYREWNIPKGLPRVELMSPGPDMRSGKGN